MARPNHSGAGEGGGAPVFPVGERKKKTGRGLFEISKKLKGLKVK